MKKIKLKQTEILLLALIAVIALLYVFETLAGKGIQGGLAVKSDKTEKISEENYEQKIIPEDGVVLPVKWRNLGTQMTNAGVIDGRIVCQSGRIE